MVGLAKKRCVERSVAVPRYIKLSVCVNDTIKTAIKVGLRGGAFKAETIFQTTIHYLPEMPETNMSLYADSGSIGINL
jgi:hypothetical protein